MLLSFAAALAACGYVAASIRLGAARLLAFLVFAAICAMLAISRGAPLWYEGSLSSSVRWPRLPARLSPGGYVVSGFSWTSPTSA